LTFYDLGLGASIRESREVLFMMRTNQHITEVRTNGLTKSACGASSHRPRHAYAQKTRFMLFVTLYCGEVFRKNLERIAGEDRKKRDSDGSSTKKQKRLVVRNGTSAVLDHQKNKLDRWSELEMFGFGPPKRQKCLGRSESELLPFPTSRQLGRVDCPKSKLFRFRAEVQTQDNDSTQANAGGGRS
jgi:hypothetical protein